ncbi:Ankyrin repeat protein fragment [Eptesipox virus]|nr:Ankyrin repeat protein fragment [Eptesipox virus]ASK51214.1 Ankyrin repeat protein fragment [Eptesipox virus]WAH70972.1 ankyrin repeat protein [Eptesipox virus]
MLYILKLHPTLESIIISVKKVYDSINMCSRMQTVLSTVLLYYTDFHNYFVPYHTDYKCKEYIDQCIKEINLMKQTKINNITLYNIVINEYKNIYNQYINTISFNIYQHIITQAINKKF